MLGIAIKMVRKDGYINQIENDELRNIIDKLTETFPDELTQLSTTGSKTKITLNKRFEKKYSRDTIFNDIRSCGIIVRDLSTLDNFKFAHKSFLEYLVSFYYANILIDFKGNDTEKIMVNSLKQSFNLELSSIRRTPEVFRFISQIISQRIKIKDGMGDIEKMNQVFKIIHPYKKIGYKLADRLIPIGGRDLTKISLLFKIWIIMLVSIAVLFVFIGGWQNFVTTVFYNKTSLYVILGSFLYLYILIIRLDNAMHKTREKDYKKGGFTKFLDSLNKFLGGTKEAERVKILRILDTGNFNLWYQTCLEMGIKREFIEKELSTRLFLELDKNYTEHNTHSS